MPQFTIYVDAELEHDVKRLGLPISNICQRALRRQVEQVAKMHPRAYEGRQASATPKQLDRKHKRPA